MAQPLRAIDSQINPRRSTPNDHNEKGETVVNLPKHRVRKEQMTSVIWTTPLGLPIVQPYRKTVRKQVMTAIQSVFISDPNIPSEGDCLGVKVHIRC
jgi:hypothetical protein